jgi:hypothetical protein
VERSQWNPCRLYINVWGFKTKIFKKAKDLNFCELELETVCLSVTVWRKNGQRIGNKQHVLWLSSRNTTSKVHPRITSFSGGM